MKGFKTIGINLALAFGGVLEATDWANTIGSDKAGIAVTIVAILNMVLRGFTNTPIFKK